MKPLCLLYYFNYIYFFDNYVKKIWNKETVKSKIMIFGTIFIVINLKPVFLGEKLYFFVKFQHIYLYNLVLVQISNLGWNFFNTVFTGRKWKCIVLCSCYNVPRLKCYIFFLFNCHQLIIWFPRETLTSFFFFPQCKCSWVSSFWGW